MTVKRNFQKLRESPGVRYESVGRGGSSPFHRTKKNQYTLCAGFSFLFARWKGLEQGGGA